MKRKTPLDMYDVEMMPPTMKAYLRNYGYSFSKEAAAWAISLMERENKATGKKEKIEPYSKEKVEEILTKYGVKLENNIG